MHDFSDYDFIDFGASKGGSLKWARGAFGGRGIGVDISPRKIETLRAAGESGFVSDASKLDIPDNTFRYGVMLNFLEHLPNKDVGKAIISQACRVCSEFVYIMGPNFDDLDCLKSLGVKKFYADWHGHTWLHQASDFEVILADLGYRYCVIETSRLEATDHSYLLPLSAKRDSGSYDAAVHAPKPSARIRQPVYGWITVIIAIAPFVEIADIFSRSQGFRVRSSANARVAHDHMTAAAP